MHQQTNINTQEDALYRGYVMNESFRKWLDQCPAEYMFYMREVTADSGTYTFILKQFLN